MKLKLDTAVLAFLLYASISAVESFPTKDRFPTEEELLASEGRIVGGSPTSPGEYPFFVRWNGCGASLIHEDIVLTAAHCNRIYSQSVWVGSDSYAVGPESGSEWRTITHRVPHPLYDPEGEVKEYDFMVMKINSASTFTPISINSNSAEPVVGDTLTTIGFGRTSTNGPGSYVLMEVDLDYQSNSLCSNQYGSFFVPEVMFCAGTTGRGACFGDSGGPIFTSAGIQVGVVSFGSPDGCADPDHHSVFSRVSGVSDWLHDQVCDLSDNPPSDCHESVSEPEPEPEPEPGEARVRIDFNYDEWPSETSWTLSQENGVVVDDHPLGTLLESGLIQYEYDLQAGGYQMEVNDSYGDGICCSHGEGSIVIVQEGPDSDTILINDNGEWDDGIVHTFTVTPEEPPSSFTCEDSSTETFLVDSLVGDKDCDWLGVNLDRFDFLCAFVDVALACPETCDVCDLLA